jgi:hypothetical protein
MTRTRKKNSNQFNLYLTPERKDLLRWAEEWGRSQEMSLTPSEVIELALKRLRESEADNET